MGLSSLLPYSLIWVENIFQQLSENECMADKSFMYSLTFGHRLLGCNLSHQKHKDLVHCLLDSSMAILFYLVLMFPLKVWSCSLFLELLLFLAVPSCGSVSIHSPGNMVCLFNMETYVFPFWELFITFLWIISYPIFSVSYFWPTYF